MQTASVHIYDFGGFQLDTAKRLLRRLDGTPVPLTSRVFETLLYMVEHHDAVLDKERIMEAVWPDSIVEENNLAQAISKLRQVFGETPGSHDYIVTVPGRGYRFVAKVTEHAAEATSPAGAEHAQENGMALWGCGFSDCPHRARRFLFHSPPQLAHRCEWADFICSRSLSSVYTDANS
jgi:DNA-binding winged helix-turn-helix (wHTH) protein